MSQQQSGVVSTGSSAGRRSGAVAGTSVASPFTSRSESTAGRRSSSTTATAPRNVMPHINKKELADAIIREFERNHIGFFG
jgi:hypothetical protein